MTILLGASVVALLALLLVGLPTCGAPYVARIKDVRLGQAIGLAGVTSLLAGLAGTLLILQQSSGDRRFGAGTPAVLLVALLLLPVIKKLFRTTFPRALFVWSVQLTAQIAVLVIFAMLIPSWIDDAPRTKQKQTIADIRNIGTAMMFWLVGALEGAPESASGEETTGTKLPEKTGASPSDVVSFSSGTTPPTMSHAELTSLLVPLYIQSVPERDAWQNPFEFRLEVENLDADRLTAIRSPGRNGSFESDVYRAGVFDARDWDQDIVWADGQFVRRPREPGRDLLFP